MARDDTTGPPGADDPAVAGGPRFLRRSVRFLLLCAALAMLIVFTLLAGPMILWPEPAPPTAEPPPPATAVHTETPPRPVTPTPVPQTQPEPEVVVQTRSESTEDAPTFFGIPAITGRHTPDKTSADSRSAKTPAPNPPVKPAPTRTPPKEETPQVMAARLNKEGWRFLTGTGAAQGAFGRVVIEGGGYGDQKSLVVQFTDGSQQTLQAVEWTAREVLPDEAAALQEKILAMEAKKP